LKGLDAPLDSTRRRQNHWLNVMAMGDAGVPSTPRVFDVDRVGDARNSKLPVLASPGKAGTGTRKRFKEIIKRL